MDTLLNNFKGALLPVLVILVAIAILFSIRFIASRYKKVAPNTVAVFYGRKYKNGKGFIVVSGGGRVLMPLVESHQEMSTSAFQLDIDETDIPNKDNVRLRIKGVASCQISQVPEDLDKAAQTFLGKRQEEISKFVSNILQGHLRSIIGKMDIDEILRERDKFNQRVVQESAPELKRVGIEIINLVIKDVNDNLGYIDSLGRRAVADAKAEAEIKVAEAQRNQDIAVSNANRDAALIKAENDARVAEAEKSRDVKKAAFKVESDTKKAEADNALAIANAARQKILKVTEAERDAAAAEAQIQVQEKEGQRKTAELQATQVAKAAADKQTAILTAEAQKETAILQADAQAETLRRTAEAKKNAATLEGEGQAAARKAVLLAEAEGTAASKKQALFAEAEGTSRLADALAKMSQDARFIIILDKLPNLLDKGGDALAKTLQAAFGPVAAAVAQIDRISIVDVGGTGNGAEKVANIVPNIVFKFLANAKAQGMDLGPLFKALNIDTSGLESLLAGIGPEKSKEAGAPARMPVSGSVVQPKQPTTKT